MTTSPDREPPVLSAAARTFVAGEHFEPDPFQAEAFAAIDAGRSVVVSAPTGSGKTLVGEYAAQRALAAGGRCFYTTPVKALSNQKFRQFRARFGTDQVGLLTGDHSIDADAPLVVMTTEVLRNMVYASSPALEGLQTVVMDEIHYLGDRSRGVVWEEILLTLDPAVAIVGLSATVSNAAELGEWLTDVRGPTDVVRSSHRPVPLNHLLYTHSDLVPLKAAAARREQRRAGFHAERARGRGNGPRRRDVVESLDDAGLLPALYFVFSRAGCDGAVAQLQRDRIRLTTDVESRRIGEYVDQACAQVPAVDLAALDFDHFRAALTDGVAAHHAGMLPLFRGVVEELFSMGLLKVVFATETLALGIHMPARSVVIEKLTKFDGDAHVPLTAAEFSQITGRAGRRGLDTQGSAVVLDRPDLDLDLVLALAQSPGFPLHSAFVPDYSMAVNMVEHLGVASATGLIGRSFAQFQTDRTLVGRERRIAERAADAERLRERFVTAGGDEDVLEYMRLRSRLGEAERAAERSARSARGSAVREAMARMRPGAVITVGRTRVGLVATVLEVRTQVRDDPALYCLTDTGWTGWLRHHDFPRPPVLLSTVEVPGSRRCLSAAARRILVTRMERLRGTARARSRQDKTRAVAKDPAIARLRKQLRAHPRHDDPDTERLARLYERWHRADADARSLQADLRDRVGSLSATFAAVVELLVEAGYLERVEGPEGARPTAAGRILAGVHATQDLLIAECLRLGVWNELDAAGLAAAVTAVVAHPRGITRVREPSDTVLRSTLGHTAEVAAEVARREAEHGLPITPSLDAGLSPAIHHWVSGGSLSSVLAASWQEGIELTAGDFVRSARLVIDVLAQIARIAPEPAARAAVRAITQLRRGVVADSLT